MDVSILAYLVSPSQFNLYDSLDFILKSGILSLVAILVAISTFFYQQHRERSKQKEEFQDRLNRICNLLLLDMEVWEKWLLGNLPEDYKIQTEFGEYTENNISTDHYHSIVYSGLITYFQKDTQREVTHFYHIMTLHNKRIFDMGQMLNSKMSSSKLGANDLKDLHESHTWKHNQEQLIIYENEMKERLPIVKKLLSSEMRSLRK